MAHGTWHIAIQAPADVMLSSSSLDVTPGAPPEVITVTSGSSRKRLELEVVDAEGYPLRGHSAAVLIIPREHIRFRATGKRPALVSDEIPGDTPVDIFIRAIGHESVLLRHDARTDPEERRVVLEPGWSTRVLALDVTTMAPVPQVEVFVAATASVCATGKRARICWASRGRSAVGDLGTQGA